MKISDSLSFKGLDYQKVSNRDRWLFIRKDYSELRNLGKKYDIKLTTVNNLLDPCKSYIDIEVKPLKEGLSFFKRLFRPSGSSKLITGYVAIDEQTIPSIARYVKYAINDLSKKLHK